MLRTNLAACLLSCSLIWSGAVVRAAEDPVTLLRQIDAGFTAVYEKVAPSVVVIDAVKREEDLSGFTLGEANEGNREKQWVLPKPPHSSQGSGFVVREDGYILTNQHVVDNAARLEVRLRDGRVFHAKLVGIDETTDIALLKVDAGKLPAAVFGDSDAVRVGQLVCAIGVPYQQDYSFTVGWVSGKGRTNLLASTSPRLFYEDYIQTDAHINPGNSGGPLFDVEGRVIGMNTLVNGIGRGLAFAIPSNMLKEVVDALVAEGRVRRPWLGIRLRTLSEDRILRAHFTGVTDGVIIDTIEAGSPAYKSDLRPADVVVACDGIPVKTARELQREILKKKPGQKLTLEVWRNGEKKAVEIVSGELPQVAAAGQSGPDRPIVSAEQLGLTLRDGKPFGAQVVEVGPESAAARAELRAEDVITEVESKPVPDAAAAAEALRTEFAKGRKKGVLINFDREGKRNWAVIEREPR